MQKKLGSLEDLLTKPLKILTTKKPRSGSPEGVADAPHFAGITADAAADEAAAAAGAAAPGICATAEAPALAASAAAAGRSSTLPPPAGARSLA